MKQHVISTAIKKFDFACHCSDRNVLLVTGKNSFQNSEAKDVLKEKLLSNMTCYISDFAKDPSIYDIRRILKQIANFNPNIIIAIGGGSCLDVAKILKLFIEAKEDPLFYAQNSKKLNSIKCPDIELIAIPTTAGSGSEATHFAVMYGAKKEKYSITHQSLLPNIVLHDPSLTHSLSAKQTAYSGLDCLTQAIESYWSVGATKESKEYAKKAIILAKENLLCAVNYPDARNRAAMQKAAYYAGCAINISKTTAPHAFSYHLTTHYNVAHGNAVSLLLSYFFLYNATEPSIKGVMQELYSLLSVQTAEQACDYVRDLMKKCGLDDRFKIYIDTDEKFRLFYDSVNIERLNNHPVSINKNHIKEILMKER